MRASFVVGLAVLVLLLTGCAEDSEPTRPINFLPLTAITIQSQYPQIAHLTTNQFRAEGDFSGVFTRDVTDQVIWSVDDPTVLEVDSVTGFARALNPGTVTVTATVDEISANFELTVTDAVIAQIAIDPATAELPRGMPLAFRAMCTFSDGTVQELTHLAEWASGDGAVAVINASGVATAVEPGTTTITAAFPNVPDLPFVTGEALLTVTQAVLTQIAITAQETLLAPGDSLGLSATGTFSDGNTLNLTGQVQWSSSNENAATVSVEGVLTAENPGETTITAAFGEISDSILITVASLESISVTANGAATVGVGGTLQLTATGNFSEGLTRDITTQVLWTSLNTFNATVNSGGLVTGQNQGTVIIEASRFGQTGQINVTVQPGIF